MESLLRKTATLSATAILSFSLLLLAACGTQKKAAEMSTETSTTQNENTHNRILATPDAKVFERTSSTQELYETDKAR